MAKDLKRGQFWRDLTNGDVLRIEELYIHTPENTSVGKIIDWERCVHCHKVSGEHTPDLYCQATCIHGHAEHRETCQKCTRYANEKPTLVRTTGEPIRYVKCACYPREEYLLGIQEMKASHLETTRFERVGWWGAWRLRRKLKTMKSDKGEL